MPPQTMVCSLGLPKKNHRPLTYSRTTALELPLSRIHFPLHHTAVGNYSVLKICVATLLPIGANTNTFGEGTLPQPGAIFERQSLSAKAYYAAMDPNNVCRLLLEKKKVVRQEQGSESFSQDEKRGIPVEY
ncbi:hypothetical protein HBH87_005750 [Parastagonospora nodorum]|nr:hypothetical protein HBH87_005750 [Parastagonospora nodorum]